MSPPSCRCCRTRSSPFPFEQVEQVIEAELDAPLETLFASFDPVPVAAASIGQVHLGRAARAAARSRSRCSGRRRPAQVESDLALLYQVAGIVRKRVKRLQFIDTVGVVDEFARSIRRELDYRIEARNAEIFRRNFAEDPRIGDPAGVLDILQRAGADARAAGGASSWASSILRRDADGRAPPAGAADRRRVAGDDLPPRGVPRRPAPGQHLRAPRRPPRAGRLRADRSLSSRPTCAASRGSCSTASTRTWTRCRGGCTTWACGSTRSRRRSFGSSCARSSTATTAPRWVRSIRCR